MTSGELKQLKRIDILEAQLALSMVSMALLTNNQDPQNLKSLRNLDDRDLFLKHPLEHPRRVLSDQLSRLPLLIVDLMV